MFSHGIQLNFFEQMIIGQLSRIQEKYPCYHHTVNTSFEFRDRYKFISYTILCFLFIIICKIFNFMSSYEMWNELYLKQ